MGIVYRCHDVRLDRDVALKFLPPELSADEAANDRFMQEARAASALNHPNVCSVFDIGETDDGALFIVMPLYAGNTLKYRVKDGALDRIRAGGIIRQVAEGLAAAHKRGIVHRDIKPDNIMLTDDERAVILDFGLVKLKGGLGLTKSGSTVGTAHYMSPEQVSGDDVDARSDLWSLGVVYYQLLTGRRPFEGDYEQAISYAILNREPGWEGVADADAAVLKRLLAKDPDDRFAAADELIEALSGLQAGVASTAPDVRRATTDDDVRLPTPDFRLPTSDARLPTSDARLPTSDARPPMPPPSRDLDRERPSFLLGKRTVIGIASVLALAAAVAILQPWKSEPMGATLDLASSSTVGGEPERHTIAVLPFTNLRNDPETDFLGYATADQVISSLSYVQNLNVRPSSSIREFEGGQVSPQEAGDALNVDYVVAGNYLRQADQMRLTVEMVDVRSNEIVWKEPIEVGSHDVFAIQDIVSKTVLDRLNVTFSQQERDRMQADIPSSPLAYEYYLRAVSYPRTEEGNVMAMKLLDQSLALDSTFAPAWSELGFRRRSHALFGLAGAEMYAAAEAAFDKALELNPNLISALADLSTSRNEAGLTDEAYELAERAIRLNPNNAVAHFARGYVLRYAGMIDESVAEMRRAIELDASNLRFRSCGLTFMAAGLYDEARRAFAIDNESAYPIWTTGMSYILEGRPDDAIRVLSRMDDFEGGGLPGAVGRALLAHLRADTEEILRQARLIEDAALVDGESDFWVATHYCSGGDAVGCLRNLRKTVNNGYFSYPHIQATPFLELVRGMPEYEEILDEARAKHERFRARYF